MISPESSRNGNAAARETRRPHSEHSTVRDAMTSYEDPRSNRGPYDHLCPYRQSTVGSYAGSAHQPDQPVHVSALGHPHELEQQLVARGPLDEDHDEPLERPRTDRIGNRPGHRGSRGDGEEAREVGEQGQDDGHDEDRRHDHQVTTDVIIEPVGISLGHRALPVRGVHKATLASRVIPAQPCGHA